MTTRTSYSLAGGGGKGYINIGGWNTTLTHRSTAQMQVPGTTRREGANIYMYGMHGANSVSASGNYVMLAAPAADGSGNTSPVVFTALSDAGTANPYIVKGVTITSCLTNSYGWYFIEGILTVTMGEGSGGVVAEAPICVGESASANIMATCTATGQGIALTAMASAAAGQAWVSFGLRHGENDVI